MVKGASMKYLIIICLVIPLVAQGGEIDFSVIQRNLASSTENHKTSEWEGVQISYGQKRYGFISYEKANITPLGGVFDYHMLGVGLGNKINLSDDIRLFGQLGYYFINNSWGERRREFNEGMYYYINDRYSHSGKGYFIGFDEYGVKNSNALAGTIGVEMDFPLVDNLKTSISLSYRHMKIKEEWHAYLDEWDFDSTGQNWETGATRNYSTINLSITVSG